MIIGFSLSMHLVSDEDGTCGIWRSNQPDERAGLCLEDDD